MTVERSPYTKDDILRAEQRVGISHPLLDVIEHNLPRLEQLYRECSQIENNQEQQAFLARNYGFLVDAVVEAGDFTLQPLELVALWSRVGEVFDRGTPGSGYHKYAIAGMVSAAYAIQGLDNSEFKKLPRYVVERASLPAEITTDRNSLLHVRERFEHIEGSIDELDFYVSGTRESVIELAFNLAKKVSQGDAEAKVKLEELTAADKEKTTPTLRSIHENFGNGMAFLRLQLSHALGSV